MARIEYPAICTSQIEGGRRLVLFSAPAAEIDAWAGVPQKKKARRGRGNHRVPAGREPQANRVDRLLHDGLSQRHPKPALVCRAVRYLRESDRFDWADSREGPFDSAAKVIGFARAESGTGGDFESERKFVYEIN